MATYGRGASTRLVDLPAGSRRFVIQGPDLAAAVRLGRLYMDRQGDLLVPTCSGLGCRTPDGAWQVIDRRTDYREAPSA